MSERYDAIVIGSGIGGLTTASLLAQLAGARVLVLERHFKLGGFTHTFRRKEFEWDVGLHYVGELGAGSVPRAVFDLVSGGAVDWAAMPEVYDRLVFPDFVHDLRAGREHLAADLIARFPGERAAIERYRRDTGRVRRWMTRYSMTHTLPPALRPLTRLVRAPGSRLALTPTGAYLRERVADERLAAVLLGQWGIYGLAPSASAFACHAMLTDHYRDGGYYPVGGAGVIAESIVPIVERAGGRALVGHEVVEILVEGGRAVGVRARHKGEELVYRADLVVSDAGAHTTYERLLPADARPPFLDELRRFPRGTANVTLYLGLGDDPARLGLRGENYWIYSGYDHEAIHAARNELVDGRVSHAYLSFPSMKNPRARGHTAEIIAFVDAEPFLAWEQRPWRRRGADYEALKARIADALVAFVEPHLPGFAELIAYRELATPITTEHFTNHAHGNIYGLPMVPQRFRAPWVSPYTPLRKLYLTGADAAFFGIVGAMMSGVLATAVALGRPWKVMSIVSQAMRRSRRLHAGGAPNGPASPAAGPPG